MYLGQNKNIDEEEEQDKNSGGEEIQRNIDVIGPLSKTMACPRKCYYCSR